jgi:hypothetical protein
MPDKFPPLMIAPKGEWFNLNQQDINWVSSNYGSK